MKIFTGSQAYYKCFISGSEISARYPVSPNSLVPIFDSENVPHPIGSATISKTLRCFAALRPLIATYVSIATLCV